MKILYIAHQFFPDFYTGVERITLNLAHMSQKAGHAVSVLTIGFGDDQPGDAIVDGTPVREFLYRGVPVAALRPHPEFRSGGKYASIQAPRIAKTTRELLLRSKPDIVHVQHLRGIGGSIHAVEDLGIPYIITLSDYFLICPKFTLVTTNGTQCDGPEGGATCAKLCPELENAVVRHRLGSAHRVLQGASAITSLSALQYFPQEFPELDIEVVPPGIDYAQLKRNEKVYSGDEPIRFLFAGTWLPHKGVTVLTEAFRQVRGDSARLTIHGSGPDPEYEKRLRSAAENDKRIELRPPYTAPQTGDVMSQADVVVMPSIWRETYGLVLHEALGCNLPVIASDVPALNEPITHGENGFLFPLGDSSKLAALMQSIVDDPTMLNPVKQQINRMAIQGVEEEAYRYEEIYRAAVEQV